MIQGGSIAERLSIWLQSPYHSPEHYPNKDKLLRRVIWQLFSEIGGKVKNFLRFCHL